MRRTDSKHRIPKPIIFSGVLQKLYGLKALEADEQPQACYSKFEQLHNQHGKYTDGLLYGEDTPEETLNKHLHDASFQLCKLLGKRRVAIYERDSRNNVWILRDVVEYCGLF